MSFIKYIGKPYEKYNCFDLVKEFYQDNFNIELKDYFDGVVPDRRTVECLISSNKGEFVQVPSPEFGDIVVIKLYGVECHIGVCVDDKRFLHSAKKIGSCLERLNKYHHLVAGFYRHQERHSDQA